MREKSLEIIRLLLYFTTIISSLMAGYYINQVHIYNELISKNVELIGAYIKLQDYEKAGSLCFQTQNYLNFIASFNPVFFSIETNISKLDEMCKEVYFYNLNYNTTKQP